MRASLSILAAFCALLAPMTLHAPAAFAATDTPAAAASDRAPLARVIVRLKADSPVMRRQALGAAPDRAERSRALGTRLGVVMRAGRAVDDRTHVVFVEGMTSEQLAAELSKQADVDMAIVDQRRKHLAAPNDLLYAAGGVGGPAVGQWYLKPPSASTVSAIDAESAWNVTTGSPSVVVGVLDTGVRFEHPDLGSNLLAGYDFVGLNNGDVKTANDGNGADSDASDPGDWVTTTEVANDPAFKDCTAENSSWHGTQTAGLIGALTNNGVGMASVGRTVKVLPVRVLGKCGGYDSDIVAGMRWAAGLHVDGVPDNPTPAKVLNLSLGGGASCDANSNAGKLYQPAMTEITARNVVVVASAGNDTGHAVNVPANCPGVIAVAGVRNLGTKVGYSSLGPEVTISAPAGNCINSSGACLYPILSTSNSGTTGPSTSIYTDGGGNAAFGTSFSAPLVAGTAALMFSVQPSLTPAQVKALLQSSARAFPTTGGTAGIPQCTAPKFDSNGNPIDQDECYCTTATCGAGMLDAGKAVLAAAGVQAHIDVSPAAPEPGQTVTLSAANSLVATGRTIVSYQWTLLDGGGIVTGFTGATNTATAILTPSGPGSIVVRLTVTDSQNTTSTVSTTISVQATAGSGGGGGGALGLPWLLLLGMAIPAISSARRRGR
jgi:serine protease